MEKSNLYSEKLFLSYPLVSRWSGQKGNSLFPLMVVAYVAMDLICRFCFHIDLDQDKKQCGTQFLCSWLLNKIISEIICYSRGTKADAIKCLIKTRFTQIDYSTRLIKRERLLRLDQVSITTNKSKPIYIG